MEGIAFLPAWTSWVSTRTASVDGLWASPDRKTTASFPVPGQFLCSQHSLNLQKRHRQMHQLYEGSLADTMRLLLSPQHHSELPVCCRLQLWQWFFWCMCVCDFEAILLGPCLSAFSPLVLLNLWEGTPVTCGPVYAQSHRTPWQWVPCPVQASGLQAVPPRGLQWEDKCQHNYLAQTWWVRGVGGKMPPAKNQTKP